VENIDGYTFMQLNDTITITFETTTYKNVDPNGAWNYIGGILQSYLTTNNLSVSYNPKAANGGLVQLTPVSFDRETITGKRDNTILSTLGSIGGILTLLATVRVLLFGSRPTNPWGLVHAAFKPRHDRLLANTLDHGLLNSQNPNDYSDNSEVTYIPFAEPVDDRFSHSFNRIHHQYHKDHTQKEVTMKMKTMEERLMRVEARNQMMELVLKSYYVDDQIFQSLKDTRDKYQGNDMTSVTIDPNIAASTSSSPHMEKSMAITEDIPIPQSFESKTH
jgi:hypothetical protein